MSVPQSSDLPAFDSFWNFDDPAGTESRFRELLPKARESSDPGYLAELLTQIARAQGLQQKYGDAASTLDVDAMLKPEMKTVRVRGLLERGRVLLASAGRTGKTRAYEKAGRAVRSRHCGVQYSRRTLRSRSMFSSPTVTFSIRPLWAKISKSNL